MATELRSPAETAKFRAEERLAKVQARKLDYELESLRALAARKPSFFDKMQKLGNSATSMIAIASLFSTLTVAAGSYQVWRSLDETKTNELVSKLGSQNSSERYFAAESLLRRDDLDSRIQISIMSFITREVSLPAKISIANKIVAKGFNVEIINSFIREAYMNNIRIINKLEGAGKNKDKAKGSSDELEYREIYTTILEKLRESSDSIVALSFTKTALECPTSQCGLNLSGAPLKRYDFVSFPFSLQSAKLSDSSLWGDSFYEVDLRGADFSRATITTTDFTGASLTDTTFKSAKFDVPRSYNYQEDSELRRNGYTIFEKANLTGANFETACLRGADFRGAIGLKEEQFLKSFNNGAQFPIDIEIILLTAKLRYTEDLQKCAM